MQATLLLALLAPAVTNGNDSTTPNAFDQLDAELARTASTLQAQPTGARVGGLLRTSYDMSSDDVFAVGGNDLGGVRFQDAQAWFSGGVGPFDVFVRLDAGENYAFPPSTGGGLGALEVRDAWARTHLTDEVQFYFGQFKCPFVLSGNVDDSQLLMIDRTRVGQLFSMPGAYQPGAALMADYGPAHFKLAVQNGADGAADENGVVARAEYNLGAGAKQHEGALGSTGTNATVGIGYFSDGSQVGGQDFGSAFAIDGYATFEALSVHAEFVSMDEELAANALGNTTDDASPFSITLGYRLDDQWEAALRYQDLDNEVGATMVGGGVNYYVAGHAAKWQLNVSQYDDDNDDGLIAQIGLSVAIGQP